MGGSMNREIKFRVWDKNWKKFLAYPCYFNNKDFNEFTAFERYFKCDEDECVVQQYTGLKDKNGKEIYEGDIIFVDDEKWIVSFDCGTFGLKYNPDDKLTPLFQYNPKELLIAGNIFENPKLLK